MKCLLFIVSFFFVTWVSAQVNLRVGSNSLAGLPAVIYQDSVYNDTIVLHNDSAATFIGAVGIKSIFQGVLSNGDSANQPLYYPNYGNSVSIAGGDSARLAVVVHVSTASGIIGSSGVVIWPIVEFNSGPQVSHIDSLMKTINVLFPAGLDELTARNLKVYMSGQNLLVNNSGTYLLKNLRLYDVAGNLLLEHELSISGEFDMSLYTAGVYFVQITFADDSRAVVKVVNTR